MEAFKKIAKGSVIAATGAALAYCVAVDTGNLGPVWGAMFSMAANAAWQAFKAWQAGE